MHVPTAFVPFASAESAQALATRFEQQVALAPHRLAVQMPGHTVTYEALNRLANRVAHALLTRCGRGQGVVALLLDQGPEAIAAFLGVVKAGKIAVPCDPTYPQQRLRTILEDAQASLVMTQTSHLALAHEMMPRGCHGCNLDALDTALSEENPALKLPLEHFACIIYTSGSTGRPKGVVHDHRTMMRAIMHYTNALYICPTDRLSLLYAPGVLGSMRSIFLALLNGASLLPYNIHTAGIQSIIPWLLREDITIYRSIPAVFRQWAQVLTGQEGFPALRLIWLGGEPVYRQDAELYKQHFPTQCVLLCGLGSSETFTYRWHFVEKQTPITDGIVPVGYAVNDKCVFLCDADGVTVANGDVGEIVVQSPFLARGYWGQPELTRQTFALAPEGGGVRRYRTGDMGRMLPDGCLIHLGRKDFQVKIRGHRVEVTEIELALRSHSAVQEVVVVVQKHAAETLHLVAYLVLASGHPTPTLYALRAYLQARLPAHMIPAVFVTLPALPHTPNGKVDRRALPPPDGLRLTLAVPCVDPRTPMETALVAIWAEVLGLSQVGIHDPFLELGGDSLLATRLIARVRDTWHVEVSVQALLEASTVVEMAVVIMQYHMAQTSPDARELFLAEAESRQDRTHHTFLDDG